ncbi:MAG: DUF192 domain-containing protein [Selenomonadaceae bacterium]|nr:DUF192 domain-containing protein [Selenomonadaceae bacterium]
MSTEKFFINGQTLDIEIAESFLSRFCVLMLRKNLPEGRGLLLAPCNSVHMGFMRFAIDVIYLDENFCIKKIVRNLRPWIGLSMCFGAWGALELPSGAAERLQLEIGQKFSRT